MGQNNVTIFVYSIGLAILLTGLNIIVDFTPKETKAFAGIILTIMGMILLSISIPLLLKSHSKIEKIEKNRKK